MQIVPTALGATNVARILLDMRTRAARCRVVLPLLRPLLPAPGLLGALLTFRRQQRSCCSRRHCWGSILAILTRLRSRL
eukprot:12904787-Prorocentrum_lima.AAC.1